MINIKQSIDEDKMLYILEISTEDALEFETVKYFADMTMREIEHRNRFKGEKNDN